MKGKRGTTSVSIVGAGYYDGVTDLWRYQDFEGSIIINMIILTHPQLSHQSGKIGAGQPENLCGPGFFIAGPGQGMDDHLFFKILNRLPQRSLMEFGLGRFQEFRGQIIF